MKFALKAVEYNATLSEETYCFAAKLYIDGVHSFDVSNRGCGGCNDFYKTPKSRYTEEEVDAWLLANREPHPLYASLGHDLEIEIGDLMTRWLQERELKKLFKKGLLATDGKALFVYNMGHLTSANVPDQRIDEMKKALASKDMQFVNANNNYELALSLI